MFNETGKLNDLAVFCRASPTREKLISFYNNQAATPKLKLSGGGGCLFFIVNVDLDKSLNYFKLKFLPDQDAEEVTNLAVSSRELKVIKTGEKSYMI